MSLIMLVGVSVFSFNFNPLATNGLSHPYHLDESTFVFRALRVVFHLCFIFRRKLSKANPIAPDGMPRFAASHLGLFCLPMSHKKHARLIWVNANVIKGYLVPMCYILSHILK